MNLTQRIWLVELNSTVRSAHDLCVDASDARPTPPTRRQVQADRTRRKLLDAAMEHFSTRHFDDVTASDITSTAGVAQGLLFHYFGNKRGVYLEALRDAAERLTVASTPPDEGTAGERFRHMLRGHLGFLSEHEDIALGLALGGSGGDLEAWQIFDRSRWNTIEWTCQLLNLDVNRPALRLTLRSCAGALDEATIYWLKNGRPFESDALVEVVVELLVTSLRSAARLDPSIDVDNAIEELARISV